LLHASAFCAPIDGYRNATSEGWGGGWPSLSLQCAAANDDRLARIGAAAEERGYRSHEFGDSLLIERGEAAARVLVDPNYGHPRASVVFIH
jgi:hypothetical protein